MKRISTRILLLGLLLILVLTGCQRSVSVNPGKVTARSSYPGRNHRK